MIRSTSSIATKPRTWPVVAVVITTLLGAAGSGAAAQDLAPAAISSEPIIHFTAAPVVQPLPQASETRSDADTGETPPAITAATLTELVQAQPQPGELSRELNCLAGAIYFEAKGESLPGQLAVGRVIVDRSKSGRFPDSYCGVVYQHSQFSFVRGSSMPAIDKSSHLWRNAVAIAQIAHSGTWHSPVEGALFFHAARVSPGWHLHRVAQIDNHVFYR